MEAFLSLLRAHGVGQVADVRRMPRSRRHPHFAFEALGPALRRHGIAYEHFPDLGGLRRPRRDSPNVGWRNASFRGYADYMQTTAFDAGVKRLLGYAASGDRRGTAVMCAEAVWWKCHRALLSDALLVRGVTVLHILTAAPAEPHQLCEFARTEGTIITYVEDNQLLPLEGGNRNQG